MKLFTLVSLLIILSAMCHAQRPNDTIGISYVSEKKDTLLLPDNKTGRLIIEICDESKVSKRPYIKLVPEDLIILLNRKRKNKA